MHVLFLSDNFPPETNAPASRLHEHARRWVAAGHRVTVVTCAPNFPQGKVHAGFKNRWYQRSELDGIEVVRVKTFIVANKGFVLRTLDYLSFMVAGFVGGLFQRRPDLVVATSPQFFAAVGGWALALARRVPFVFELRDLWPASLEAVGALKGSWLLRAFERLELFLYRRAAGIVCVTEAFKDDLVARGIAGHKISVITNGVDLDQYQPVTGESPLAREVGIEGKFVVGYVGTHGMAHALDAVLDAAAVLRERDDVHFLFVGDGAARERLIEQASALQLTNVTLHPSLPKERMPEVWSACDLALVHLRDTPLFATVIPSKIFEAMGMGLPIVIGCPAGEATQIVERTRAGVVVSPEDPAQLARAVAALADDRERVAELARASLAAAPLFSRDHLAGEMLRALTDCAQGVRVPRQPRLVPAPSLSPAPAPRAPLPGGVGQDAHVTTASEPEQRRAA
ncbi:MAG: glycosyltransferase family 4 protein [Planctomycetota bacterium]